jgi:hypothetical protein
LRVVRVAARVAARPGYCGGGDETLQTPSMHSIPCAAAQHGTIAVQRSYVPAHVGICDVQMRPPASPPGWQYPPQHWVPVMHDCPLAMHASTLQ